MTAFSDILQEREERIAGEVSSISLQSDLFSKVPAFLKVHKC